MFRFGNYSRKPGSVYALGLRVDDRDHFRDGKCQKGKYRCRCLSRLVAVEKERSHDTDLEDISKYVHPDQRPALDLVRGHDKPDNKYVEALDEHHGPNHFFHFAFRCMDFDIMREHYHNHFHALEEQHAHRGHFCEPGSLVLFLPPEK